MQTIRLSAMSNPNPPRLHSKPFYQRVLELSHSLLILKHCAEHIDQGKIYLAIPIFGQLRALLCSFGRGKGENIPLLIDIAKTVGIDLKAYYCGIPNEQTIPLPDIPILHIAGPPFSTKREASQQNDAPITIEELIGLNFIQYNGENINLDRLIRYFADKSGGAHYDKMDETDFFNLLNLPFGKMALLNLISQTAKLVIEYGTEILQTLCQCEMHFILYVPDQEFKTKAFIFDFVHPQNYGRIYLAITEEKTLEVGIIDLNKNLFVATSTRSLESLNSFAHLNIQIDILENLTLKLSLIVDGVVHIEKNFPNTPILTFSEIRSFFQFYNSDAKKFSSEFEHGLGEICIYSSILSESDRQSLIEYLKKKIKKFNEGTNFLYFTKNSYGLAAPGSGDMKMTGLVKHIGIDEIEPNVSES